MAGLRDLHSVRPPAHVERTDLRQPSSCPTYDELARTDRSHAKAGNVDSGLSSTSGPTSSRSWTPTTSPTRT